MPECQVCGAECQQKCSKCKTVFYCSAEHQTDHWKKHKIDCCCYQVAQNEKLGRHLLAIRNLEAGDVVFTDRPLIVGPNPNQSDSNIQRCVQCFKLIIKEFEPCEKCGWPTCGIDCTKKDQHPECDTLLKQTCKAFRFDTLIVIRALLLQETDKKKWENLISLEAHLENRGPSNSVFKGIQEKAEIIQKYFPDTSAGLIHKIYGILDVNATEYPELDLFILYPTASLVEHDCTPNTSQMINPDSFNVTFRAAVAINQEEHITSTYTNILWGTQDRRKHLKDLKYFDCSCARCMDPTEFGTNFSALVCQGMTEQCHGVQLPISPTIINSPWKCSKCALELPAVDILQFTAHLNQVVDERLVEASADGLEDLWEKLKIFLHPHHFVLYQLKHSLVQLMKDEEKFDLKLNICQEMIELTKKIDPGNARLALYLTVLLNEQFLVNFTRLKTDPSLLDGVQKSISEAKKALQYEQTSEMGGKLMQVLNNNEIELNNWMNQAK